MSFQVIYRLDGKQVTRSQFRRRSRARRKRVVAGSSALARGLGNTLRPQKQITSESLAVHPDDAAAATEAAKTLGFPGVHFCERTGRPTFDSFSQRDAYARSQGFHVRDRTFR